MQVSYAATRAEKGRSGVGGREEFPDNGGHHQPPPIAPTLSAPPSFCF